MGRARCRRRGAHNDELPARSQRMVLDRAGCDVRDVRVRPGVHRSAGVEGCRGPAGRPLSGGRIMSTELIVVDAPAWHDWLRENHAESDGAWLVLAKKNVTTPTSLTYDEALEEALCHGWIDGQRRGRDDKTFLQRYTPRRAQSMWSQRNVGLIARLEQDGRMQDAGRAEVERAKADGRWD